jgi:IclR family transcriptional regulator, acetate operon repressor
MAKTASVTKSSAAKKSAENLRAQRKPVRVPTRQPVPAQEPPDVKPRVQSAARTINILLAIAQSADGMKVKEISDTLSLPRQVTYHLLHTLIGTGIIRKNGESRYVLGLAAASIGDGFRRQLAPPEHLAPLTRAISESCGETAYASGWMDNEIMVLATARGRSPVQAAEVPHGFSEDAHARASGKLLLALASPVVSDAYLASHKLNARTRNTITSVKRLQVEFDRIRARGYAVDEEEFFQGLCCMAVPIESLGGRVVLGISVPSERFHANFDRYLAQLRATARLSSARS